ncbi:hypothetical protein BGW38_001096 [Lunasporangiospora selenospora]|uniref:Calcium channel YVC1-like C-terminal transmembrane domain-containing protein n=1 Tax=Lunasporangiospora selenospora TaxID=979761 RepID=A0A9P6KI06_9FUNG|nr:hypothetical protein BGW38_001096 [Lunasporangiospora selenospora]
MLVVLKAFSMRQLIDVLTYDFAPVRRKDTRSRLYLPHFEGQPSNEPMSALEVAISGRAKHFLSNPLVQEIVTIDEPETCLNASQQEIRTVSIYDSRNIKFLRLSRLRVPRYKTTFQMVCFSAFIIIYTLVTFAKEAELTALEVILYVFALSYTLDEFIQLKDSGPSFYFETVWNLFDVPIYIIFLVFMSLRIATFTTESIEMSDFAYDFLACNAVLLWPRLFAALDHYKFFGTMLIVLRQMMLDAMLFLALSFIFYVGFQQAFYALHDNTKTYGEIAWLLLQVFLGSAFLGFEQASELSELFGAPLMVSANAQEEFMYLFSVKVMEEVKSDELYEFQPPFNILAGIIVWPCRMLYAPEIVGRVSRGLLRLFYFPELVGIWLFEMLVLKKRPQYMPTRQGQINQGSTYGTTFMSGSHPKGASTESQTIFIGGGVAKRRYEAGHAAGASNSAGGSSVVAEHPSSSPIDCDSNSSRSDPRQQEMDFGPPKLPPGSLSASTVQQLQHLNTRGLGIDLRNNEILTPYWDNILRFREASSKGIPGQRPTSKGDSTHNQEPMGTPYSFYPAVPIGMRNGHYDHMRHGSISGYDPMRHMNDDTTNGASQERWTLGDIPEGGGISAVGGNFVDQLSFQASGPYPYSQSAQTQHSIPPNQYQQWQPHQRVPSEFVVAEIQHLQELQERQQQRQDEQCHELTLLVETRFAEVLQKMEQMDRKLDRLTSALASEDQPPASTT